MAKQLFKGWLPGSNSARLLVVLGMLLFGIWLRFCQLGSNPPSLYWDEAAIGVDSYSLAQTGRDQYGRSWLQPIFPSYGDYKAPVYIWLTALLVKLAGLSKLAVRLPSAIFGLLTVWLVFLLSQELFKDSEGEAVGWWVAGLMLVAPWAVHFSRIGFESGLSLFWLTLFVYWFLKGLARGFYLPLAGLSLLGAIYSYFSARVIGPLLGGLLTIIFLKKVWRKKVWFLLSLGLVVVFLQPLFQSALYPKSQQLRMSADNVLTDRQWVVESSRLVEQDNFSWLGRVLHHRYFYLGKALMKNYLTHFSPHFLFLKGDLNLRHHSGFGGQLYLMTLPLSLIGLFQLVRGLDKKKTVLLAWLLAAPVAASVPYEVPHASRAIYLVVPVVMITGLGLAKLVEGIRFKKDRVWLRFLGVGWLVLLAVNSLVYTHDYFKHYPNRSAFFWQDGYQPLFEYLRGVKGDYDNIYLTQRYRLPYLYAYFYLKPKPETIQQVQAKKVAEDQFAFGGPARFGNINFGLRAEYPEKKKNLVVVSPENRLVEPFELKKEIKFINGDTAFLVFESQGQ